MSPRPWPRRWSRRPGGTASPDSPRRPERSPRSNDRRELTVRVLITGASGFLGSAVSDALLARGDEVVGLTRDPERARSSNPTVGWHGWDATAERPPVAALQGVEAVLNLIGEPIDQRWTDDAKRRI